MQNFRSPNRTAAGRSLLAMSAAISVALVGPILMATDASAEAVVAEPILGTAGSYSVLGAQTVTNTGPSVLSRSAGVSPGSAVDGFPPGLVLAPGTINAANPAAAQAQADALIAYTDLDGRTPPETVPDDLVGQTIRPGLYTAGGPLALNGTVTLDGGGNPAAVFIFQSSSTLIVGSGSQVLLTNGAQACHVYWQVDDSTTIGTGSAFAGTIVALQSVSLDTNATLLGRAIALNGAVTLDSNVITNGTCADAPTSSSSGSSAPSSTPPTSTTPRSVTPTASTSTATAAPTTSRPSATSPTAPTNSGPSNGTSTTNTPATRTTTTDGGGGNTSPSTTYLIDTPQIPITPVGGVSTGGGATTTTGGSNYLAIGALALLAAAALAMTGMRRNRRS